MRPAESTHWYTKRGEPAYTVIGKNGQERPTTLRDARKLALVPSVTSIIALAARPGLEHYKQEQLLYAALTLPREPLDTEQEWINKVWLDSREHARQAAETGTDIHAAIQTAYEGETVPSKYKQYVAGAQQAMQDHWPDTEWLAEHSFAHELGYGGKTDLHNKLGDGVVVDCKTKLDTPEEEFATIGLYSEHYMQLAAYRMGLGLPLAKCAILFVSVRTPGLARVVHAEEKKLQQGWRMFSALLEYWKAKTGME